MRKSSWILIVSFLLMRGSLFAQTDFYDINTIQEIRIIFEQSNWDEILDSLFIDGDEERLKGNVEVNGTLLEDVGVRYKGFSSYSSARNKNPFNIKLDFIHDNQRYDGHDKIKLSNVIQDPSFVREVLSYEIARKYMPASRANFAMVYVNDVLQGLYTNVEAIGKEFLYAHFGTKQNAFFKGNPDKLDFDGENSNLENHPGNDPSDYHDFYEMKSDEGWSELVEFIDTLNDHPDHIANLLNVDRTLWMHAFNYSLINFDSYIGYAQNYYLYRDHNQHWNPIIWDLNMSFASFRVTDASLYWDGFSILEAMNMDPLLHYNSVSVIARPLLRNLFNDDTYRRMYLAHMRTLMDENVANQDYYMRALSIQNMIDTAVAADTNKFYSYADFQANLDTTVSDLVDYPGLAELMDGRLSYLNAYPGFRAQPVITNLSSSPAQLTMGDELWITASISNTQTTILAYRFSGSELFQTTEMLDDGNHQDGASGDGLFGASIANIGNKIQYYLYSENDSAGAFSPVRAAYEYYELEARVNTQDIVINEMMAADQQQFADANAQYEDWVELYNNTDYDISLGGMYFSNDETKPLKWALPDQTIKAGTYAIIWADKDTLQEGIHCSFKLDSEQGSLILSHGDSTIIDSMNYSQQYAVTSVGRLPNGTGDFAEMLPSFKAANMQRDGLVLDNDFALFPNPATDVFYLKVNQSPPFTLDIVSVDGRYMRYGEIFSDKKIIAINTDQYTSGIYCIRIHNEQFSASQKVIIK